MSSSSNGSSSSSISSSSSSNISATVFFLKSNACHCTLHFATTPQLPIELLLGTSAAPFFKHLLLVALSLSWRERDLLCLWMRRAAAAEAKEGVGRCAATDLSSNRNCRARALIQWYDCNHGDQVLSHKNNLFSNCYARVERLQKQLQEEIDLHVALANAMAQNADPLLNSPSKVPDKIQELIQNIITLEITVSNLEKDLVTLHLRLCNERIERHIAEAHLGSSPEPPSASSVCLLETHTSSSSVSKFELTQIACTMQKDDCADSQLITDNIVVECCPEEEMLRSCNADDEGIEMDASVQKSDEIELKNTFPTDDLSNYPNKLSEEMVRCMRNIFLCLSGSSDSPLEVSSSEGFQSSPVEQLSSSSFMSFSGFSQMTSLFQSPDEIHQMDKEGSQTKFFDPYGVNSKMNWGNIGCYLLAAEVSWMSIGMAQLQYAAEALKGFRFLVEQLSNVNPACMSHNQKLAFWINVYNALMMHAYLAFGVPSNDIKLFSLMQKASYTIGGQSFSAADIEYVILKMKTPVQRRQLAQCLALHKFKISEEHKEYSVDRTEPLAVFALSCGMYSSPAVRIFTADNVQEELQTSMRDYIQASIGLSDKGKLLVPELLHSFAKGVVEDSLLVDWICRYLSPDQVTVVRDSKPQWKQRLLGVRSFSVIPFDSSFRYLFLPDKTS
ncbi:hypothetical protein Cni_G28611 [Canna indica]|uniref:DUF547 domain-containing protein n=1 Tax=Canna indica TaxID=4628 RepID=A0AAQ3L3S5_9LILI|nr:hypothetical protein Cni_G28611 [Canna indica]